MGKFHGKVFKPAGDNVHVFFRQFAKVDKLTEPTGDVKHYVCELSNFTKHAFETLKLYYTAIEEAAGAAKKAVETAKGGDDKKDEGMENKDPMMMDPPMEMMGNMEEAPPMMEAEGA